MSLFCLTGSVCRKSSVFMVDAYILRMLSCSLTRFESFVYRCALRYCTSFLFALFCRSLFSLNFLKRSLFSNRSEVLEFVLFSGLKFGLNTWVRKLRLVSV